MHRDEVEAIRFELRAWGSRVQPSLTAKGRDSTVCESCQVELMAIRLVIDGEVLLYQSCSQCESRSWHRDGRRVDLGQVVGDLAATDTRYRRSLPTQSPGSC